MPLSSQREPDWRRLLGAAPSRTAPGRLQVYLGLPGAALNDTGSLLRSSKGSRRQLLLPVYFRYSANRASSAAMWRMATTTSLSLFPKYLYQVSSKYY